MKFRLALLIGLLGLCVSAPALAAPAPPGIVAAYSFDEGSGGSTFDASGNGHTGVISGATWSPSGRYGGALSFDGIDDSVLLGSLGAFSQDAFTLEAWVNKSGSKKDVAILGSWTGSGPMLWIDHLGGHHRLTLAGGLTDYLDSGATPSVGEWHHQAATWDGTTARYYIDGTLVASRSSSGPGASDTWRIGAYGAAPTGFFDGLIDDIRIYDRALGEAEINADLALPVTIANADIPTTPDNMRVTARSKTSLTLEWNASTDDVGVTGYRVFRNGVEIGTVTGTAHEFAGLTCSTSHELEVEALDGSDNVSPRALEAASTSLCNGPVGLVASYRFDEGAGTVAGDSSGNGHGGAVTGASWTGAGRHGGALAFDGIDDHVSLGALGTFYQSAFTLQAWVRKQSETRNDTGVVGSWSGDGPMIWVDHLATRYRLTLGGSFGGYLDSGHNPVAGEWQHLAATYDGTIARFYVDGVEVASRTAASVGSSNAWRIGAYGGSPGGFFDGIVDDVRVYNRALSSAEIVVDMNQPVPAFDTTPPTAPSGLTATGAIQRATLEWTAASDDVLLARYNVHRSTTAGFTPSLANRIAQTVATSYLDEGLAGGTYYYRVTAEDAAGNVGPPSNQASASVSADSVLPTVALTAPAAGTIGGEIAVAADASDDQLLAGVQFKLDGVNLGAEDTLAPYSATWDTRGALNGPHVLTAVVRDGAGNTTTSAPVAVTVSNAGVSTAGLRVAYGLDDGSGVLAADSSGNHRTGTLTGAGWGAGRFGGALSLDGVDDAAAIPPLGTFYGTAFTYEAWVFKQTTKRDVGVVGTWSATQGGGAMIWIDHVNGNYRLTLGHNPASYLDSGQPAAVGTWQHVAATYDGTIARIYVDGVEAASAVYTGSLGTSNAWRIGAYGGTPGNYLDGRVDNVRIYDRALTPAEIAVDKASRIQPDKTPPTVQSVTPANGAPAVSVGGSLTVEFDEPMRAASLASGAFELRDESGVLVPTVVSYDLSTSVARFALQEALLFGETYSATVKAGVATDLAGNALASNVSWSFTAETAPPPVLLATAPANPFTTYLAEILRNEGVNAFGTIDAALITPALLSHFDVVVLGETALTTAQVSMLTTWVNGGGNLIAMRPDKKLAALLGLTTTTTTLANTYLRVNVGTGPGAGIVGSTIQFHGTADRYTLNGATAIATLFTTATSATSNPAVSLRTVGSSGGQAAAFTYDLARSVVYTRQGNPAWAGQERDGVVGIRPNDMFFGASVTDPQPDWIDTNRIAIPQADEQQRLLVNLITQMDRDKMPLPHFWYLPRGEKAAVVMSGDDHSTLQSPGGTPAHFDRFKELSPPGCNIAQWDCVRSSAYVYPTASLTPAQAAAYAAEGFEVGLHTVVASCPTSPMSAEQLSAVFDQQLGLFQARYVTIPSPVSNRTHCVYWPDWASNAKVERAHGMRMDANYYHYPPTWIGAKPGFMNGGGFPMRFADLDGSVIDVFQQNTNMTDESGQAYPASVDALLAKAVGAEGYYGTFGANMHIDEAPPHSGAESIVESAQARGVPVISNEQLLEWVDGRNASSFTDLTWNAGTFTFTVDAAPGALGLQTLLPIDGPSGILNGITRGGVTVPYSVETVKGIAYARLSTPSGTYEATYNTATPAAGLVASYSFDAGVGPTASDTSGNGNHGTISGATWSTSGRYGSALSFDGVNDLVTMPDADSLDLTTAMTLEAWVRPSAIGSGWRTVLLKERPGQLSYAFYGAAGTGTPSAQISATTGGEAVAGTGIPVNAWTHLAATYDGASLLLYADGVQVASAVATGPIVTSTGALRVGGNTVWAEWFAGLIDEVRVYNRVLTPAEIQADMAAPIEP